MRLVQWHMCARCQHKVLCLRVCVHVSVSVCVCVCLVVLCLVVGPCAALTSCTQCALGSYNPEPAQSTKAACRACPDHMTTRFLGSDQPTDCIAALGFVSLVTKDADGTDVVGVVPCPSAFNCTTDAVTMETLELRPGFWRAAHSTFNARPCPNEAWCHGGPMYSVAQVAAAQSALQSGDPQEATEDNIRASHPANALCAPGHHGPYCSVCMDRWYKVSDICTRCPEAALREIMIALSFVIGVAAICLLVMYCVFKKVKRVLKTRKQRQAAKELAEEEEWTTDDDSDHDSDSSHDHAHPSQRPLKQQSEPIVVELDGSGRVKHAPRGGPQPSSDGGVKAIAGGASMAAAGAGVGTRPIAAAGSDQTDNGAGAGAQATTAAGEDAAAGTVAAGDGAATKDATDEELAKKLYDDGFDETSEKATKMKGLLIKVRVGVLPCCAVSGG